MLKRENSRAPMSNRYAFDFGECSTGKGFAQIDTKQDASYYGTWANPIERTVVVFAEGDVTRIVCDTAQEFIDYIRECERWNHEAGYGPMKIDTGMDKTIDAAFRVLGLVDLLH